MEGEIVDPRSRQGGEMKEAHERKRLPRAIRKHLRHEKARIRHLLPPAEARRAIEQLVNRFRRMGAAPTVATTDRQGEDRAGG